MLIVGIDIAKNNHEAIVITQDGTILGPSIRFTNTSDGAEKLLKHVAASNRENNTVVFGLEATGHYWLSLYCFLIEKGFTVHVINPIQSDSLRNLYIRKTKNDAKDSFIIAEVIRFNRFSDTQLADEATVAMKQLCRYRGYLVDQISELKVKAITILDQIFPEYASLFSDTFGVSSKELLLNYSSPEEILAISTDDLTEFLKRTSHGTLKRAKAEELLDAAKNTFGIKFAIDSFSFQLRQIIEQIKFIEGHIQEVEEKISCYFEKCDSHLTTIPGIGAVLAASIESEIGDISRFDSPAKLVAFVGIDPSVRQSGEFNATHNRMSKRGSPYLRRSIWMAAVNAARYDPVLKAYYQKKCSEGKHHLTAVGAVARKLTYVIFAIMRDKRDYVVNGKKE